MRRRGLYRKKGSVSSIDTNGLLAYFKKDETSGNIIDSVNGFTGTPSGVITLGAEGKINTGINYSGGHISLDITSTSKSYTFFWWAKITVNSLQFFFDTQSGRLAIGTSPGNGSLANGVAYYDGGWKGFSKESTTSGTGWRFYALTLNDVTSKGRGYIDGLPLNTDKAYSGKNINGTTRFGKAIDGGAPMNNANMDEFGIYERCLSDQEILNLYNNGNGITL